MSCWSCTEKGNLTVKMCLQLSVEEQGNLGGGEQEKGAWEQRETFHNSFTTQTTENKISSSRVGTEHCQRFWPASGYVYMAVSHSQ